MQVELLGRDPKDVARRTGLDHGSLEKPAQLGDLALYLRDRRHRSGAVVEVVREPLDGDDPVRREQQDCERRTLLRPTELERTVIADDLERPQQAELGHARTVTAR